ncbi:MAG: hypothetical protein AAGU75_20415, partial [Bacillota bacterium]
DAIADRDNLAYKMHLIRISVTMRVEFSNKEKIKKLVAEANQKYGNHPEIAKIEAAYLFNEKFYGKALEKYLYALRCHERYGKSFVQNDFAVSIHEVYYNIAQILYLMNKEADALTYFVMALKSNKYYTNAFNNMFTLCKTMPENEIIALINSVYDIANEEDVKFIVSQVAGCSIPKIVLYYASKWNNIYGYEDDVLIYAFLAQGNYHNALEIALLYLKNDDSYSPLVTSILIMGQLFSEAEKIKDDIGDDYFELVMGYFHSRKYSGNSNSFITVLSKLIMHADTNVIDVYLKLDPEFAINSAKDIAENFLVDFQFHKAIYYFNLQFESQHSSDIKAVTAFEIGYCFYKLKQYQESVDWFDTAIENGYAQNDIAEFLEWIIDQSSNKAIKNKAEALRSVFNASTQGT